ncbi:sulfurtransferase TusA family protein [Roseibacterium sp. SDUM158016]|jgi:tRNA 2-thiouridine synthesizing protein A|uniref:sulfurtransferase TusA family protein n=1 Tax=Roseicyclus sediminis TaxID=2980997 RepID=UPI0021CF1B44|nr:sulfurtransferase TusA family protein [Roseibacterium sp. SDUM158016]MCU4654532.1 sulfurtransferase TusA family protein [Roseibacterium sp. SDUM158016]
MEDEIEIDATGLKCPLPVLRLRKRLEGVAPGRVVRLLASDPMAAIDVPHFCAEAGHAYLGAEDGPVPAYRVRKGG